MNPKEASKRERRTTTDAIKPRTQLILYSLQRSRWLLTDSPDYQLGRRIARLLNQSGGDPGLDNRILNSLPDLLAHDPSLHAPLRDLILRPGFRNLRRDSQPFLLLSGRDSLLSDLQLTYSRTVTERLQSVLNGILNLPDTEQDPSHQPFASTQERDWESHHSTTVPPPPTSVTYTVQAPSQSSSGLTAAAIALLALICGAGLVGLIWLLLGQSQVTHQGTSAQRQVQTTAEAPELTTPQPVQRESSINAAWGRPEDYKFGQNPSQTYPNTCAFSQTDARGEQTLADKSQLEFWACRNEGGNEDSGYAVTWGDGKRTVYRFMNGGTGMVIGTNGQDVPMQWHNDSHNGQQIIVINHQDGATSWIPGHVND